MNIEFGRLKGWVKDWSEAAQEMDIPDEEAKQSFNSLFKLGNVTALLLTTQNPNTNNSNSPDTSSYIAPTPEELEHLLFKRIAPALGIEKSKGLSLTALADIDRKKIGQWCSGSGQIPYSVLTE